jgi:hypothetical protein
MEGLNISSDRAVIDMDPNLTLAHITHNTSMILLHHPIGHPPRGWNKFVALPKECSAQTCELAAVESSNIVDKFLAHTPIPFVNVQFSFCAFIAAKALLFEHQATRRPLRYEFQRLVCDLWEMAKRWGGNTDGMFKPNNQAGTYANHLERLQEACQSDVNFRFDFYDHNGLTLDPQHYISPAYVATPQAHSTSLVREQSLKISHTRNNSVNSSHSTVSPRRVPPRDSRRNASIASPGTYDQYQGRIPTHALSPNGISPPYPPPHIATSFPPPDPFHAINTAGNQHSVQDQSLLNLSGAFMDSRFLDMDRVITFEGANFFLPGDTFSWQ